MKKLLRSFLIIAILLFTGCGRVTEQQAIQTLSLYLQERYGEEFDIGFGGRRGYTVGDRNVSWYEYEITPQSYKGTNKLYDKYYDCIGTVEVEKTFLGEKLTSPGDSYALVLLKEQANKFYGKKLKELFGENVLPILEIDGLYFDKEKDFISNVELSKKNKKALYIEGGIYIFGRVENDEDREKYREEIYKFLSFMKEIGTFEYVELDIMIIDERVLTKEFRENIFQTQEKLSSNPKTRADIGKRKERRSIMNELNEYFDFNKNYSEIINSYNKGSILENGSSEIAKNASLLYLRVYSPKLIHSKGWNKNNDPELYEEIKEYNTIADVEFEWEAW